MLYELFSKFGELKKCYISKRNNGKSAGYGYLVAGNEGVYQAIIANKHTVGDRDLVTMPFKNENSIRNESNHYSRRRICISRVPGCLNPTYLRVYFEKFGPVDNFFEIEPPKK